MTVQNQSFWGVLKDKFNFGENTRDFLAKVPLTTNEMELGYYHLSCPTSCLKILGNWEISGKSRKCLELKRSVQLATRNENCDNCAKEL